MTPAKFPPPCRVFQRTSRVENRVFIRRQSEKPIFFPHTTTHKKEKQAATDESQQPTNQSEANPSLRRHKGDERWRERERKHCVPATLIFYLLPCYLFPSPLRLLTVRLSVCPPFFFVCLFVCFLSLCSQKAQWLTTSTLASRRLSAATSRLLPLMPASPTQTRPRTAGKTTSTFTSASD